MKWFFLLLIVVNLAVFLWGVQKDNARQSREIIAPPGMGNLRMISELEGGKLSELKTPSDPEPKNEVSVTEDTEVNNPVASTIQNMSDVVGSSMALQKAADQMNASRPSEHAILSESDLLKPTTDFDITAEQESTAVEIPDNPVPEPVIAEKDPEPIIEQLVRDVERSCGSLGPMADVDTATALERTLSGQGVDTVSRKESVEKSIGYWVIVPPLATKDEAVGLVNRMRDAGFKDVGRFHKGEEKNGISLGVFSRRANAEIRQKEVAKKGFETEILHRTKQADQFWLDFELKDAEKIPVIDTILNEYPAVGRVKKTCDIIANP